MSMSIDDGLLVASVILAEIRYMLDKNRIDAVKELARMGWYLPTQGRGPLLRSRLNSALEKYAVTSPEAMAMARCLSVTLDDDPTDSNSAHLIENLIEYLVSHPDRANMNHFQKLDGLQYHKAEEAKHRVSEIREVELA